MYSSTFIFRAGEYDDEFNRLDQEIASIARSITGFLGEEAWESPDGSLFQNIYYWDSLSAMEQLITHPAHAEAKSKQACWLNGYRTVIAEVLREYGDGKLPSPHAGRAA